MSTADSFNDQLEEDMQTLHLNGIENAISESNLESPRVSTAGTDDPAARKQSFAPETADYSAPGLDSLHWAGVKKKDYDARSVASSMAAEKDDKSIYEEPAVGAVEEEDSGEDAPEEIFLPQGDGMSVDAHHSIGDSMSKQGSFADISEQISPRQNDMRLETRSQAQSTDNGSVRPISDDGELYEEVGLQSTLNKMPRVATSVTSSAGGMDQMTPRSPDMPPSPMSHRNSVEFETASPPVTRTHSTTSPPASTAGGYQSKTMQQITAADQEEKEHEIDGEHLNLEDNEKDGEQAKEEGRDAPAVVAPAIAAAVASAVPAAAISRASQQSSAAQPTQDADIADLDSGTSSAPVIQHFQIEAGGDSGPLPVSATASPFAAQSGSPPARIDMGPEWEVPFKDLLYYDGVDALGRPVVVLNADAVPAHMKSAALVYVETHLEPIVNEGHYVLVCTARKTRLPSLWIMSAYQNLPRPFRKNVQFVVLVKPTGFLKWVLALMRPFISTKAHRKIKTIEDLDEIGTVTGGEVTLQHLGARFLADDDAPGSGEP